MKRDNQRATEMGKWVKVVKSYKLPIKKRKATMDSQWRYRKQADCLGKIKKCEAVGQQYRMAGESRKEQ